MTALGSPPVEDQQALDVVPELAHVARPVVRLQDGDRVLADAPRREAGRLRELLDEVLDELGNVLAPLGQARDAQRHDVEAVVEILAEPPFAHLALEIAAGRGDDAHVDRDLLRPAEAQELLLDEDAQHLALRLERHVGHLVDVERASVRLLERADLARAAGAVLGSEQLLLDAVRRHRRRVEDDEGPVGAVGLQVNDAGGELLAGAGGATDQDAAVGRRYAVERAAQMVNGGGLADHFRRHRRALAQLLDLALQLRGLEGAQRHEDQPVLLEGLLDIVVGAALDGGDRGLDVAVAGDDDDG